MPVSRRALLAAAPLAAAGLASRAAPVPHDVGLTQDWFHEGFLDLREDLNEAREAGQRLAVVFEQRGCPYCLDMHRDHLARPEIEDFIRPRFRMVQLNLHGARHVTDLDGEVLEERRLARRWGVGFTPSIVFLPEQARVPAMSGGAMQVARMAGLLPKPQFLGYFAYVAERGYADGTGFLPWWARRQAG